MEFEIGDTVKRIAGGLHHSGMKIGDTMIITEIVNHAGDIILHNGVIDPRDRKLYCFAANFYDLVQKAPKIKVEKIIDSYSIY